VKPVSVETECKLRAALARLVTGDAIPSDDRLSVANLAREAGVSRATANRAGAVLAELREAAALAKAAATPTPVERGEDEERSRRAGENILAQHVQVRALLRGEEHRRAASIGDVVPIIRR
jgi:DNA-binding transcriptional regulator YhcF (GntR family)